MTSTEYFRATGPSAAREVRRLISHEPADIATCEPIAMEILCGATDDDTRIELGRLVNGLTSLGVDNSLDFRAARTSIAPLGERAKRFGASTTAVWRRSRSVMV